VQFNNSGQLDGASDLTYSNGITRINVNGVSKFLSLGDPSDENAITQFNSNASMSFLYNHGSQSNKRLEFLQHEGQGFEKHTVMVMDGLGKIGMGTASPGEGLDVRHNASIFGVNARLRIRESSGVNYIQAGTAVSEGSGGRLAFTAMYSSTPAMTINTDFSGRWVNIGTDTNPTFTQSSLLRVQGYIMATGIHRDSNSDHLLLAQRTTPTDSLNALELGPAVTSLHCVDFDVYTGSTDISNGTRQFRFTSDGRLGVGSSSSPEAPLHVFGSAIVNNDLTVNGDIIGDANDDKRVLFNDEGVLAGATGLHYVNNRLGVGTDNPDRPLHVHSGSAISTMMVSNSNNSIGPHIRLEANNEDQTEFAEVAYVHSSHDGHRAAALELHSLGGRINLMTVSTSATQMTILDNGNVGIGTDDPAAPLDVNGNTEITGDLRLHHPSEGNFRGRIHARYYRLSSGNSVYWETSGGGQNMRLSNGDGLSIADNLDVGTTGTPSSSGPRLRVRGDARIDDRLNIRRSNGELLALQSTSNANDIRIVFLQSSGASEAQVRYNFDDEELQLFADHPNRLNMPSSGYPYFETRLGIGTDSPSDPLHVAGKTYMRRTDDGTTHGTARGTLTLPNCGSDETDTISDHSGIRVGSYLTLQHTHAGNVPMIGFNAVLIGSSHVKPAFIDNNNRTGGVLLCPNAARARLQYKIFQWQNTDDVGSTGNHPSKNVFTDGMAALNINENGRVGISTTSPEEKLDVRGNIQTRDGNGNEVLITPTGWRTSTRASIKILSDSASPSEIDFRHIHSSTEKGWQISARHNNGNMEWYHYDGSGFTNRLSLFPDGALRPRGHTYPAIDNTWNCGISGNRWSQVWAESGEVNSSDANVKDEVKTLDLGLDFINLLRPVEYKFKDYDDETSEEDTNGNTITKTIEHRYHRKHLGFIAQEVKATLDVIERDYGVYVDPAIEGEQNAKLGLRYTEFLAPLVKAVQELSQQNTDLQAQYDTLQQEMAIVLARLDDLESE